MIEEEARRIAQESLQVGDEEKVELDYDPVPLIKRKHFESAWSHIRKSVNME